MGCWRGREGGIVLAMMMMAMEVIRLLNCSDIGGDGIGEGDQYS